ncbi:MAG: cache domain-containing protein, partial [Campylobacterota bacterium]|nr:cache domain-containing protein [Campylobacterota bacterium]
MRLKITIGILFLLSYGLVFFLHTQTKNERIDFILNEKIKSLETHYDLTMDYFIQDVSATRKRISKDKKIIELFSKAQTANSEEKTTLRKELFNYLSPTYKIMQTKGILQLQFVFPDNRSFLRVHKPSKYGDDLTDTRYSFKHANKTKETVTGFEQGRTSHAFRYAFPFFDENNNHLGAVEISLSSYALQDKLLSVNKVHSHFLVNKEIFDAKAWESPQ